MPSSPLKWGEPQQQKEIYPMYGAKRRADLAMDYACEDLVSEKRLCVRKSSEEFAVTSENFLKQEMKSFATPQSKAVVTNNFGDVVSHNIATAENNATDDNSQMDTDCVPACASSVSADAAESRLEAATVIGAETKFCQEYCGVGKVSPASGYLRCYCRPSWDAMMYPQPFYSDYY